MLQRTPRPRRLRRSVVKRRGARRGYSRQRRGAAKRTTLLVSIITTPATYLDDGFWFRH